MLGLRAGLAVLSKRFRPIIILSLFVIKRILNCTSILMVKTSEVLSVVVKKGDLISPPRLYKVRSA